MSGTRYEVIVYNPDGTRKGAMSGMGRHNNTWNSDHSRSAAYRHARQRRLDDPRYTYKVEPV